jgi:radical SAM protein with 4Fe4S-binding SPASM domain
VNLISNGTLATKERAKSLFASGLRTAQISLEGTDSSTHDYLTAIPGAFEKTLAGISALQAAGIAVQTNTTLNAFNKGCVREMPRFVKSLGITRMSMNLYIPTGTLEFRESLAVSYTECATILPQIQKAASMANMTFYWYSPMPMCIYNPIASGFGNKNCAACDGLVSIAPDGALLPCSSYDEPIGNMLETDFSELWFSGKAQWFKRKEYAPENCKQCPSFIACQAACPLYWKFSGYKEIRDSRSYV